MTGDNPTNALERDGRGNPRIPDPITGKVSSYGRISRFGKLLEDPYALHRRELNAVAHEFASSPASYAKAINGAGDDAGTSRIVAGMLEAQRLQLAADRGSYGHFVLECIDRGMKFGDIEGPGEWARARGIDLHDTDFRPGEVEAMVRSWQQLTRDMGLLMLQIEEPRVNHGLRIAGTPDRVIIGTHPLVQQPTIGDLKYSRDPFYPAAQRGYANQMHCYAISERFDPATGQIIPDQAPLQQGHAIIFHGDWDTGTITPYRLDLTRARMAVEAEVRRREWTRQKDLLTSIADPAAGTDTTLEDVLLQRITPGTGPQEIDEALSLAAALGITSPAIEVAAVEARKVQLVYGNLSGRLAYVVDGARTVDELRVAWEQLRANGRVNVLVQERFRQRRDELTGRRRTA